MTTGAKIARRKLTLLQLAQELNNVSRDCRIVGYSRQQFYEMRRNYRTPFGSVRSRAGYEGSYDRLLLGERS